MKTKPYTYINYSLSKENLWRQRMHKKDLLTIWNDTKLFLKSYTDANIEAPYRSTIKIYPIFDRKNLDQNLKDIIETSERQNLEPVWIVSNENIEKAINGLNNVQNFLPIQPSAIELKLYYRFNLLDKKNILKDDKINIESQIEFTFSKKHICMPFINFPVSEPNEVFWEYYDQFKLECPFDLNEKLLRKYYIKNDTISSIRKIERK